MLNVVTRRNSAGRGYINDRWNDYHNAGQVNTRNFPRPKIMLKKKEQ